ncbi:MAG: hypothetical protein JW834_04475 [Candidatus Diapherotrites archaeon]|nr:hypothetical protein [Candidatus Diapherotrites archaeon]
MNERAQVSAELIIVIAAVLAVALLLVRGLQETAHEGSARLTNKSAEILSEIDDI